MPSENGVEIISVGNELLTGRTLNANLAWLAKTMTSIGANVLRAHVVRDDLDEISTALKSALSRGTRWIIVSGGLGPTFDDMTLQGVALAIGRKLTLNEQALGMMKRRYRKMAKMGLMDRFVLTAPRKKMVSLPEGASPLHNPAGTAPGVNLEVGNSVVICLPGVPKEMVAIVQKSVVPIMRNRIGRHYHAEGQITLGKILESDLAPLIDLVMSRYPRVYVKSHPKEAEGAGSRIEIIVTASTKNKPSSITLVEKTLSALEESIRASGGIIIEKILAQ